MRTAGRSAIMWNLPKRYNPGEIMLCYLTGQVLRYPTGQNGEIRKFIKLLTNSTVVMRSGSREKFLMKDVEIAFSLGV